MSLTDATVAVMLPITDATRAHDFYGSRLDLPFDGKNDEGDLMFQLAGGSQLGLRVLPDAKPSPNTAMSFKVADIAAEIADLESRGVRFEDYDMPGFKTVDHVFDSGSM